MGQKLSKILLRFKKPKPILQNDGNQGSGIWTFGFGALAGAIAAGLVGTLWYFNYSASTEATEEPKEQHIHFQTAMNNMNTNASENLHEEEHGTVKMCEICMRSFVELKECGIAIVTTPCGHLYCKDCIVVSLMIKPECPHCRSYVRQNDLTRIFI